jgi:hypothetical protein
VGTILFCCGGSSDRLPELAGKQLFGNSAAGIEPVLGWGITGFNPLHGKRQSISADTKSVSYHLLEPFRKRIRAWFLDKL